MNKANRNFANRLFSSISNAPKMFDESKTSSVFKKLRVGPMKRLYKYYTPESINLAGGIPMDSTFPFQQIDVKIDDTQSFTLTKGESLFLNYHRGDGLPALKEWISQHVSELHRPQTSIESCISVGSTDSWAKTLSLIDTDVVLFDQYAYGQAVGAADALGKQTIGVKTDEFGMIPNSLREAVTACRSKGLKANLVYFVPIGQNPTGTTIPLERKQALYQVCQELDMIIVEDDAYYYLSFDTSNNSELPGIKSLPKSFLSLDTDGRVIRFDSLSKFIAPGARIGWVSAPSEFIQKYLLLQEITTQFPSGFSQSIFLGLVKHWTTDQLHAHLQKIQLHYKTQCDAALTALQEHFTAQECEYVIPSSGMFLWLTFPGLPLSSFELFKQFADVGVIAVPGDDFFVEGIKIDSNNSCEKETKSAMIRLTFAASSPAQIAEGIKRMAVGIKALSSSQ